jgi:alanine or glycine:cation symporter, AGCS family
MGHAAARTNESAREGVVAMMGPFIDTLMVCTITGLAIVVSGAWTLTDKVGKVLTGAPLTTEAFRSTLGTAGELVVALGLALFAFSTIISWSYYGDRSLQYLLGDRAVVPYRIVYTLMIPLGAMLKLEPVWNLADIANALMALPNLAALIALSGVVVAETRRYEARRQESLLP